VEAEVIDVAMATLPTRAKDAAQCAALPSPV
jgi:hypothetical protein